MTDIIVVALLLVIIGAAAAYIIRARKSGVKCIGCPSGGNCAHNTDAAADGGCGCGCGCHTDTE